MQASNQQQRPRMKVIALSNRSSGVQSCRSTQTVPAVKLESKVTVKSKKNARVIVKLEPAKPQPAATQKSTSAVSHKLSQLLHSEIKSLFKKQKAEKLRTQSILDALTSDKSRPWDAQRLDARKLSILLQPYGIHSKDLRFEKGKAYKGYSHEWFNRSLL